MPARPTDGHAQGAFPGAPPEPSGPAFIGPLESVFRYPLFAIVPVVALVLIGLLVGVARDAVYSAEARVNVGRVDVPAYTLQGVTVGNATLAASYARALAAPEVIERAARDAGVPVDEARGNLTGSQIPKSTLIRIEADGSSSAEAQRLANAAALQLIRYVTRLNVRQQEDQALQRYRRAQQEAQQARDQGAAALAQPSELGRGRGGADRPADCSAARAVRGRQGPPGERRAVAGEPPPARRAGGDG